MPKAKPIRLKPLDSPLAKQPGPARTALMIQAMNRDATLQEVADLFGVTRERVRQILTKAGYTYRSYKHPRLDNFWHLVKKCEICEGFYLPGLTGQKTNSYYTRYTEWAKKFNLPIGVKAHAELAGHTIIYPKYIKRALAIREEYLRGDRVIDIAKRHKMSHPGNVNILIRQLGIRPRYDIGRWKGKTPPTTLPPSRLRGARSRRAATSN